MSETITLHHATLYHGDCLEQMRTLDAESVDAIVTDPPYGLSFMNRHWDYDVPSVEVWREALRVLKPGGHLLSFSSARTYHRMVVAIEDAGFEVRDQIMWVYGSGFPKSLDISKQIDKRGGVNVSWFGPWFRAWREQQGITQKEVAALFPSKTGALTGCVSNWELGFNLPTPEQFNLIRDTYSLPFSDLIEAEREIVGQETKARSTSGASALPTIGGNTVYKSWDITAPATEAAQRWAGWGTALKPAHEPICLARKPLIGTVAENVMAHGTGALNIDASRIPTDPSVDDPRLGGAGTWSSDKMAKNVYEGGYAGERVGSSPLGRWPANLIHDGSEEVVGLFPASAGAAAPIKGTEPSVPAKGDVAYGFRNRVPGAFHNDTGSAARFFYTAKAHASDRDEGLAGFDLRESGVKNGSGRGFSETDPYAKITRRNHHPTVKPTDLMRYLCRLITPRGGLILDPYMGSGSTGKGAVLEGFRFIGIEREADYLDIAAARIRHAQQQPDLFHEACA